MDIYKPICCPTLSNQLGGNEDYVNTSLGRIYYNYEGEGDPLVLIHGLNAGASNFEWKNNFKKLSAKYKVYALDLPGFGRSDKLPMIYNARAYIAALNEFIINVVQKPCFILTSGLSSSYCCYISYASSGVVKALAMVAPNGLEPNQGPCQASYTTFGIFSNQVQGDGVYNAFTSKQSLEYFLKEYIYTNPANVTPALVNYYYDSSHQCPNAKYAPASFVSGLCNLDINLFYNGIQVPMLILWGSLARLNPVTNLDSYVSNNQFAVSYVFEECGLIPQAERADEFNSVVLAYFKEIK